MIYVLAMALTAGGLYLLSQFAYQVYKTKTSSERAQLRSTRTMLSKSEMALRNIANGSGNPVLEAQIALDEITQHYSKEIM